jgi:hypothetical protein
MSAAQVSDLMAAARATWEKNAGDLIRQQVDSQVSTALAQFEAQRVLAESVATPAAPRTPEVPTRAPAFSSTPGDRQVAFATSAAIVVADDDADEELEEDDDILEEDDTLPPLAGAVAGSVSAAAAPGKGDPHPSPAAFWVDKAAVPPAMGSVSGNQKNFAGESEIRD